MKIVKSLTNCYNKLSNFGKILVFIALLLVVVVFFRALSPVKEGWTDQRQFLFKEGTAVYDDFYADIYDYLVFNMIRTDYEVGIVMNNTMPNEKSVIADIGCGTGHQVANLSSRNLDVIGIDISPAMISKAKTNFPGNAERLKIGEKYAKDRITKTKITFNDFVYNANFKLNENDDIAIFDEKFKFNDGKVRKQEHKLYMEDLPTIVNMAQEAGFILHAKVDMVKCAYEYQYLYVFIKPS